MLAIALFESVQWNLRLMRVAFGGKVAKVNILQRRFVLAAAGPLQVLHSPS